MSLEQSGDCFYMIGVMNKRKTYGQILNEHRSKTHEMEDDPIEYARAIWADVLRNATDTVNQALKAGAFAPNDFYIAVHVVKDPLGAPQFKCYARMTLSTPVYNLICFKYYRQSCTLELMYQIPHDLLCYQMDRDPVRYLKDPHYGPIARTYFLWKSGELIKWIDKENGEENRKKIGLTIKETSYGRNHQSIN